MIDGQKIQARKVGLQIDIATASLQQGRRWADDLQQQQQQL